MGNCCGSRKKKTVLTPTKREKKTVILAKKHDVPMGVQLQWGKSIGSSALSSTHSSSITSGMLVTIVVKFFFYKPNNHPVNQRVVDLRAFLKHNLMVRLTALLPAMIQPV